MANYEQPKHTITLAASATKGLCIFEVRIGWYTVFQVVWPWQTFHNLGVYMVNKALANGAKPGVEAPANQHTPFEILEGGKS